MGLAVTAFKSHYLKWVYRHIRFTYFKNYDLWITKPQLHEPFPPGCPEDVMPKPFPLLTTVYTLPTDGPLPSVLAPAVRK